MDPIAILSIIQLATNLAQAALNGTAASNTVGTVSALEEIVAKVLALHHAEVGTPMDLTKFQHEDHID